MIAVLETVVDTYAPPTAADVAAGTGLPTSTVFRLVKDLSDRDLVHREPTGALRPGARFIRLANRAAGRIHEPASLELAVRRIAVDIPESISGGLVMDDSIVLVTRVEPASPLRVVAHVGDVVDPTLTAMGKAVLAFLPHNRQRDLVVMAMGETVGPAALDLLGEELAEVERDGFARDEEQFAVGYRCRAVPLIGADGRAFGAISVAGPSPRFSYEDAENAVARLFDERSYHPGWSGTDMTLSGGGAS